MLLTDTVGFIDDLPKELVTSFRATLEEMEGSHLLIHLADASHPRVEHQIASVRKIIREIGMGETPELLVFNKCDRVSGDDLIALAEEHPGALFVSAQTGEGLSELFVQLEALRGQLAPAWGPTADRRWRRQGPRRQRGRWPRRHSGRRSGPPRGVVDHANPVRAKDRSTDFVMATDRSTVL